MTWTIRPRSEIARLSAIRKGTGPLIVMIHGVGLRSEAWNAQIDLLAERYSVIAIDMPGHGESQVPSGDMAISDYTDAIAATLTEPALIVGHSMGAVIATDLAERYSDSVRGLAALNAIFERTEDATAAVKARANSLDGKTVGDPSQTLIRWFGAEESSERAACELWLTSVSPLGYKIAYSAFAHSDGPKRAALEKLHCPALFMTGENEPNSTPEMSLQMAKLAPHGRAEIISGAAHMMPMTHATEVNRSLLTFADEVWT